MNDSQRRAELRRYRMLNWSNVLVDCLDRKFEEEIARGFVAAFQEKLYIRHDPQRRSVSLFAGKHPVGNSLVGAGIAVEEGAALTVSQGVDGSVAFFLYPFKSELMHRREEKILWGIFNGPDDVRERTIRRAIADAARYWRVSSALDGGSRFDRLYVGYLLLKARLREAAAKRTRLAKMAKIGACFVGAIGFLSAIATLAETSVPRIWSRLHPSTNLGMPVITGWYTFCPQDKTGATPRLVDLLYDIRQNAGKVAFFDVQVDVACVMETTSDPDAAVSRTVGDRSLSYSFSPGKFTKDDVDASRPTVKLYHLIPDNGTVVTVLDDSSGRNALTRLSINGEGVDDELYGPYLIKATGEDAALTLTLTAPMLDSTMQDAATNIASQRRKAHENDAPPNGAPPAIPLSEADLRKFKDLASSHAAIPASGVAAIKPLPLPPLPSIPPMPLRIPPPDVGAHN